MTPEEYTRCARRALEALNMARCELEQRPEHERVLDHDSLVRKLALASDTVTTLLENKLSKEERDALVGEVQILLTKVKDSLNATPYIQ
jgi:hypothetical protein